MTPIMFINRLEKAKVGDKIVYFKGYTGELERERDDLRRVVARAYIDDRIIMVQKRTGLMKKLLKYGKNVIAFEYDYIAIKR